MGQLDASKLVAYAVALVSAVFGIVVLTGYLKLQVEPMARYTFGVVLILMGIYRFAITRMKSESSRKTRRFLDE
jgi:hypothetical protein